MADGNNGDSGGVDGMRIRYGFLAILFGFLLVGAVTWAAMGQWQSATDVAAVVGLITGMVGVVIGAFFGVQVGSQGKERAESARNRAEKTARVALALVPQDKAEEVLRDLPE